MHMRLSKRIHPGHNDECSYGKFSSFHLARSPPNQATDSLVILFGLSQLTHDVRTIGYGAVLRCFNVTVLVCTESFLIVLKSSTLSVKNSEKTFQSVKIKSRQKYQSLGQNLVTFCRTIFKKTCLNNKLGYFEFFLKQYNKKNTTQERKVR